MSPASESRTKHLRERGQAMVEFALVAPILFVLVFGVFQLGVVYMQYQQVGFAASEGARCAAVARAGNKPTCAPGATSPTDAAVTRATAKAPALDLTASDIVVSSSSGWKTPGTVSVTITHPAVLPIIGEAFTLRATSTSKLER